MEMEVHVLVHRLQFIGDRMIQEMNTIGTFHGFLSAFLVRGQKLDLSQRLSILRPTSQTAYTCARFRARRGANCGGHTNAMAHLTSKPRRRQPV
jgi:hypothetical protein